MKIEFLTHYGHEYYCPLSLVRVHGMSMMEYYTTVESQGDNPVIEEEHLWPAEVREQLIQPQSVDLTNTSESFPIKNEVDEEDIKPMIPPLNFGNVIIETPPIPNVDFSNIGLEPTAESVDKDGRMPASETISNSLDGPQSDSDMEVLKQIAEKTIATVASTITGNQNDASFQSQSSTSSSSTIAPPISSANEGSSLKQEEEAGITSSISSTTNSDVPTVVSHVSQLDDQTIVISTAESVHQNVNATHPSTVFTATSTSEDNRPIIPPPQKAITPNTYAKEGSTQESIYKTIMKRLSVLEGNMTLSLRYLDEQNKNLNDVLKDMERKHQEQLIQLIGHLNDTASLRIDSMVRIGLEKILG
jgi:hypothetical protein